MKARLLVVVTAVFVCSLFAAVPSGAAVTLGSDLASPAADGVFCAATCTVVQSALPGKTVASPIDGVIVRWRVRTNGAGGPFQLRVAKPFSGNDRVGAGWSAAESPTSAGTATYATRLPIRTGDNIGLDFSSANSAFFKTSGAVVGATSLYFAPLLPDSVSTTPSNVNTSTEMLYNADVEADADRDGFGDETQDHCPAVFGTSDGCDVTAPKLLLTLSSPQRVGSLSVLASVDEASTVTARAAVSYRSHGKLITIKGVLATRAVAPSDYSAKLKLKFTSKRLARLRKLLRAGRKLSAKVSVSASDASGNAAKLGGKLRLIS